jgi:hypothetical protein
MDKVILVKMIGLVLLVFGVIILIAGLLFDNKFFKGTGFAAIVIAGALIYYSVSVTPAYAPDEAEERAFNEALKANTPPKKS